MPIHRSLLRLAFALAVGVLSSRAAAQEISGFMGPQWDLSVSNPATYQWRLDYQQGISEHWYFETGWVNDGHFPGHLRDGIAAQIGVRTAFLTPKLSLGFAAGVDRFYDTITDTANAGGFADLQGWMFIGSGQVSYYMGRWILRGQVNVEIAPPKSYDAASVLIGLGYQLQANELPGPRSSPMRQDAFTTQNEVTAFIGQTVPNGGKSDPKGIAGFVEYRHGIWRYFDLTFSWINQSDDAVLSRMGLATQIWPTRSFGPVTLGLGLGAYFAVNGTSTDPNGEKTPQLAGMVSPTMSYRFGKHWLTRFIWNRTVTTNNTNTDFFGLGLGWRW